MYEYKQVSYRLDQTGAATDEIVWQPASGKAIVITNLTVTTSAAATLTVSLLTANGSGTGDDEETFLIDGYFPANGGQSITFTRPFLSTADDVLLLNTSAGNAKVVAIGWEE